MMMIKLIVKKKNRKKGKRILRVKQKIHNNKTNKKNQSTGRGEQINKKQKQTNKTPASGTKQFQS
jgi:hypothetical protein